ncbi:MAG: hypothetical protein ACK5UE_04595 [Chitinophagales bacterium]|jgi:hypothetical protein|nr:hypothetical protein [Sphingobacteriales bacterium]
MAFITINVPDNKLTYYKQILSEFKEISLENDKNEFEDILTPQMIKVLEERRAKPIEKSITLDELKLKIKAKYAKYGF